MEDTSTRRGTGAFVDAIADEVTAWPHATERPHRSGGREFYLGASQVGHVHRSGLVDVQYRRRLRDRLVGDGFTRAHSLLPDSGWTSFRVADAADVDRAVWLLWVSYLATLVATPHSHLARSVATELDVDASLAALPATVRAELDALGRPVPSPDDRRTRV